MKVKKEAFFVIGALTIILSIFLVAAVPVNDSDIDGYNSTIDCNDNNSLVWQNMTGYSDNDLDGYGAGNISVFCTNGSLPDGYVNNSLDCNDNDAGVWQTITGYLDRDLDFYGDNNPEIYCALNLPYPYVNISGDCNDVNPFMHPGATELCNYNDDNCDGSPDNETYTDLGKACPVGIGECMKQGIMVCNTNNNGTFCQGTAKKPSPEICDGKDNDCDGLPDENNICNDTNFTFVVNSPNRDVYKKNNMPVNLSLLSLSGKKADKISYIDYSATRPREIILCKVCNQYGASSVKTINLKDGMHDLLFRAIVNGTEYRSNISVMIDGKNPRLYLPSIRLKSYTNGSFNVNYDEDNLKKITLFYDNKTYENENCSSGKKQACSMWINLSEYSGKDILYSFLVEDIAGNLVQTKNMSAEVDITSPVIENITYPVIGNSVYFRINITEKNFKDVSYFDNSDKNARWKILCSVLKYNICEKPQRLSPGEHNVTIRVVDRAGNTDSMDI